MDVADRLYLTRVHHSYEGDTSFPEWDETLWQLTHAEHFERGAEYPHPFSFETYERK